MFAYLEERGDEKPQEKQQQLLLRRTKQAEHEQQKWQNDAWNVVHHHSYSNLLRAQQSHAMHSAQLLLAH
jgi:hypothetical protein